MPPHDQSLGRWRNNQTQISFNISDDGRHIRATAVFPLSAGQSGHLRYSLTATSLVIEHIETAPENGTGLGPLLMLFSARKAAALQKEMMSVVGLRYPDYYAKWGFDIETPRNQVREKYIAAGRQADIPKEIGVAQADSTTSNVKTLLAKYIADIWEDEWASVRDSADNKNVLTSFPRIED